MVEVKGKKTYEDNSCIFKRLASRNSLMCDGTLDPKPFKDWIRGMEKLFDALQCPKEWRVGFIVFYLKDEVDLWQATVRERRYELGFGWNRFKGLIKNYFYPLSLQKAKENEFIQLQ